MNTFELSRNFWNWAFENPETITTNHAAIYFFAIEHCNRLGGKEKFGLPSQMTMEAVGIKKHQTYIKYFNELIDFGFFKLIEKSKNQYSSNIISLMFALPKMDKALDKAIIKHGAKQTESNGQSKVHIDKQINNKQINNRLLSEIEISEVEDSLKYYFEIALKFQQLFIKNLKANQAPATTQEKATFKNYVDPIRLMFESDKITREQLLVVYNFLDSPQGDFWKSNILSTKKLREQFSQLAIKSKNNGKRINNTTTKTASTYNRSEAINKTQAYINSRNGAEKD